MKPYYEDEWVTLYHGDCLDLADIWTSADVLVTDPPYGMGWSVPARPGRHQGQGHKGIQNDSTYEVSESAFLKWGTFKPAVVFGSPIGGAPQGVKQTLVWRKTPDSGVFGAVGGFRRDWEAIHLSGQWPQVPASRSSVFESKGGLTSYLTKGGHPHTKPVGLLEWVLEACPPGVIADPFAGSGSTLIAARNLGRKVIGVELEERYCETIVKRLSQQAFDFSTLEAS